jgi:hypothetical protein
VNCLSVERPPETEQVPGNLAKVAFQGAPREAAGLTYRPTFAVATGEARGQTADDFRDDLKETFEADYEETKRLAGPKSGFQVESFAAPTWSVARMGGAPGHRWTIDSIATFEGKKIPWRAVSLTTVYRDTAYILTVGSARADLGAMGASIDRYFASARFDGCD